MYRHILCVYEDARIVSGKEPIKIIRLGIFRPQYFKGQLKIMTSNVMNSRLNMAHSTEDGSTEALLQILYGQYLILGVFWSCMF